MLTSLFISLSLILTTIWGFIFWDAKLTAFVIVGLLLVVCAIVLCLYTKEKDEKSFSWKWLFYVLLAFFGNAGCSIVQRTQQVQYNGEHGNMLMVFAIAFCALAYLFVYLKSNKTDTPTMLKSSWWAPVCAGICNLILNVFVMLMALSDLSPSLIYPVIGVGGLAVVTVFSLFVFKEKMHWWQWLGVAIGAVAVGFLSI
jgi:drug/metabolite transporter (DMT)-like permease